jgi:hypothetical protein
MIAGPPVDLSEFEGMPLDTPTLRAATDKIMTEVAALVGKLRGEVPPAEPFHPAIARRKQRAELRQLAEQQSADAAGDTSGTAGDGSGPGAMPGDGAAAEPGDVAGQASSEVAGP